MQRRGGSEQPVKGQRANRPKARKAPTAQVSTADLQEQLDRRTRERDEALEQLAATSGVLEVISKSTFDLKAVLQGLVESAARLCKADKAGITRQIGGEVFFTETYGLSPEFIEHVRTVPVRPERGTVMGLALLERRTIHVSNLRVPRDDIWAKAQELGGFRTMLGVPMLREGTPIGVLALVRTEVQPFTDKQIELVQNFAAQAVIAIENTRLLNELRESLQQQTATADVLKVISSSPGELEAVFRTMLENAVQICGARFGNLSLFDGNNMRVAAMHNAPPEFERLRRRDPIAPLDRSVFGTLVRTKKKLHISDITAEEPYASSALAKVAGARTTLAVPMLKEDELIGAINIYRQEIQPFTDKQVELLENFAAQAVIAIENARLLSELRESLQQQTATADVLKVISSSPGELAPVFEAMLANATRICEAKFGNLFLREGDGYRAATAHGEPTYVERWRRAPFVSLRDGPLLDRVTRTKQVLHIPDLRHDQSYRDGNPRIVALVDSAGARTFVSVPMLKDSEIVGTFAMYRQEVRPFTDKQIELVQNFAAQAVIAIENTRLLNELRQRTDDLSESLEQQTATSEVLKVISSSPGELEPVFKAMLENATRICEAKFGVLFRSEGDAVRCVAMHGAPEPFVDERRRNPVFRPAPATTLARALATKKPVQDADALNQPQPGAIVNLAGARTILSVPMLKENELVGVIVIYRQEVRPFTDKQIELVKNFAAQAVIAIENTRLLNELRESLQQQTATADVLKVISRSTFDLQTVLDTLVELAARLCRAERSTIRLVKDNLYHAAAMYGHSQQHRERMLREPLNPGRGSIVGRVVLEGKSVHVVDAQADADRELANRSRSGNVRTILGVPLLREGTPIGVLLLQRSVVQPFTDKEIELAETFADQAVIAIENVRLFDEVQARTRELSESLEQQTATADVLKVISRSTFDLKTVLNTLVESAARLCDADMASIPRRMGAIFDHVATYGYPPAFREYLQRNPISPGRGTATGRAVLEGKTIHIPDVLDDPEYSFIEAQKTGGYRTVLGVPLMREGAAIGVLVLARSAVRPFTAQQIELVETFADQAVIAIENVRLFESVEARTRELAKSLEDLRTTQDRLVQTEKLASLGQLTAGIAHEIKNPLNFVNNFSGVSAELIDELQDALNRISIDHKARAEIRELTDTLRGNLDKVVQHGKRADAIVKNMLLHSRAGSGEHRPVDINAVVEESLNLAWHGARAEKQGFNITLEKSFDPTAGEADVFPQEITRALLNLISNGFYAATKRKAETNGGDYEPTLAAATKNLGDRVEIRIRDNGTGIPPDVKERLFTPFFTTKPAGEGTGLGLSISHDIIVKQHGGSIEVDTLPGEFTEFRIILPRTAASLTG